MVDIANMRPSALRKLHENLEDPNYAEDFLKSLASYLTNAAPDGGVDSDRLYVVGLQLSNARTWERIHPLDVMRRAGHIPSEALLAFTAGMPDDVARLFLETRVREDQAAEQGAGELLAMRLLAGAPLGGSAIAALSLDLEPANVKLVIRSLMRKLTAARVETGSASSDRAPPPGLVPPVSPNVKTS